MVGRGRAGHPRARRGAPVPQRAGRRRRIVCTGTSSGCTARCSPGCGWRRRPGRSHGIGIDSWAVDYGLLDADGALLGNPFAYRDARTDGVAAQVLNKVDARELYERTGLQQLPFNTIYQLVAAAGTPALEQAATMLLLPDLLGFWLTGSSGAERTNASTTGLYDVRSGEWATDLADRIGIPPVDPAAAAVAPATVDRHAAAGRRRGAVGLGADVPVIAVGSHDTASAVVGRAQPATSRRRTSPRAPGRWSASSSTSPC